MEDRFVKIYDWMLGSASFLAKWMGVKKNETVYKALASLVKKGLIEKRERWERGEKMCDYRPVRKTEWGGPKNGGGTSPKNGHQTDRPETNKEKLKEIKNKERQTHMSLQDFLGSLQ